MLIGAITKIRNGVLLRYRIDNGLSQSEAARLCGVSHGSWNSVECMRFASVRWGTIQTLAVALDVAPDEICPEELRQTNLHLERAVFREVHAMRLCAIENKTEDRPVFGEEARHLLEESMAAVMETLTFREREILKLRFGINDNGCAYTLAEIAKIFKVTCERVRGIEAKAIRKLQHPARAGRLVKFLDGPEEDDGHSTEDDGEN